VGSRPIVLVGLWTVEGTDEEAGTVLRIAPRAQLSLWRSCGTLNGAWAGRDGLFLATLNGGTESCVPAGQAPAGLTPTWLLRAAGFEVAGTERILVDQDGKRLARLLPGGKPKVTGGVAASEAEPPKITDEDRAELEATVVPPATKPATVERDSLMGKWVPASSGAAAFAEFKTDGTWTGSDGCNGNGGRWVLGANGRFLATSGPSTLIACDGAAVPSWLSTAAQAGLAGDQLVLFDATGTKEVGRIKKG
jgi:heat shock protein HslJ